MNSVRPACLVFDLDGTLLDSLPGIEFSVKAAFSNCELRLLRSDLRDLIGPPIRTIMSQAGKIEDPHRLDALEAAFRSSYDSEGWKKTICFPDAQAVLRTLSSQNYRLFVVSNKPVHISRKIMEREGILDYFEFIITLDSRVPPYGSKEEMLRALITHLDVDPAELIMVGDTMEDAIAAENNAVPFAWAAYGYSRQTEARSFPSNWNLERLSQLLEITERHCDR